MELRESIEQIVHTFAKEKTQPLGEKRVCPNHGAHESFRLTYLERTATVNSCPKCLDGKLIAWKEEAVKEFIEKAEGVIQKNVPRRFWAASINSFETPTPQMQAIKAKILEFISNPEGKTLTMIGKPGTGKTHLGYAIYKYFLILNLAQDLPDSVQKPIITSALDIIRSFKECWRQYPIIDGDEYRPAFISGREVLTHYGNTSMLVVDEVGIGFQSDIEKLILTEIINYRYERMVPIVLMSNLKVSQLSTILGERVIDRLKEGEFLTFDWESWRRKGNSYQPNSKSKSHGKAN